MNSTKLIILLIILMSSCRSKEDINDVGKRNGNWVWFEERGKEGKWIPLKENGNLELENGKLFYFHSNGVLKTKGEKINNQKVGKWYGYYENGNIYIISNYISIDSNYHIVMFENGNKLSEGLLINHKKEGKCFWWFENGSLKEVSFWKNGLANGKFVKYHSNGQINRTGFAKDGLNHGEFKYYYENGNLRSKGNWVNNVGEGKWINYDSLSRKPVTFEVYENGKLIKTIKNH